MAKFAHPSSSKPDHIGSQVAAAASAAAIAIARRNAYKRLGNTLDLAAMLAATAGTYTLAAALNG